MDFLPDEEIKMKEFCKKLNRTKKLDIDIIQTPLRRCLNTLDITLLGIGHMVGAGIYVLTGDVAHNIAGPGVVLSFIIAGIASVLAALCYAEFGARVPKAGSAYAYTYVTIGELWAFIIGWNILLEHMVGAASVARAWSGYLDSLFGGVIRNSTLENIGAIHIEFFGTYPDFIAMTLCLLTGLLLALGVKGSSYVNSIFTVVNLCVIAFVVCFGFYWAKTENWTDVPGGFLPYGFGGVISGAAACFYAFVGFDSIATAGEEVKNPSKSIPLATMIAMSVVTLSYVLVSSALTLMVPYTHINPSAALPDAFSENGASWAKFVVTIGALAGMTTSLFGGLFALPRCVYAMATDGLLFKIHPKTQVPLVNLIVCTVFTAILALIFDIEKLVEFMSIGTLMAYTIVAVSVIILRYQPSSNFQMTTPDAPEKEDDSQVSIIFFNYCILPKHIFQDNTGRFKPSFAFLESMFDCEPGFVVSSSTLMLTVFLAALCSIVQLAKHELDHSIWWAVLLVVVFLGCALVCYILICLHEQNSDEMSFKVPFVPFIPTLSVFCNLALMTHLHHMTWLRFGVWITIGLLVYFLYGIRHSKENDKVSIYSTLLVPGDHSQENNWGSMCSSNYNKTFMVTPTENSETCCSLKNTVNKLSRKKILGDDIFATPLKRCLTTLDICLLGVGHMIGAGIYVLTGEVSKTVAGPSIVLSYIIAGFTSLLAAICYAEFGARVPKAGSAYVYTYVTLGEVWAFIIGWDVILEQMIGAASVARAWSGYLDGLLHRTIANGTEKYIGTLHVSFFADLPDFVAVGICLLICILLIVGVKGSTNVNTFLTAGNLVIILFVIGAGIYYAKASNWSEAPRGFFAFGFQGVIQGAAKCFFAFVGFDSIATSGEEAKTPSRSIPIATFVAMLITTTAYVAMSVILTLLVRYDHINPISAFPDAFADVGATWVYYVVSIGALIGMTTSMFGSLFALPRVVYAMAADGLLFKFLAYVHPKTQTPINTLVTCTFLTATIALLFGMDKLVDFMSIGTLMAYTMVSASVIVLRYRPNVKSVSTDCGGRLKPSIFFKIKIFDRFSPGTVPAAATLFLVVMFAGLCCVLQFANVEIGRLSWWPILLVVIFFLGSVASFVILFIYQQSEEKLAFKVPWVPVIPALSILCNIFLLTSLDMYAWIRFAVWMVIGMLIYFGYGIHHSKNSPQKAVEPEIKMSNEYEKILPNNENVTTRF
uniref:Cationic amino acid transporter C-terminal domain-containing protein n=1 Tax=Strigamia maritima TaxID=126957 RepID=T1IVD2_STRMM